jgi:hypothetical protein
MKKTICRQIILIDLIGKFEDILKYFFYKWLRRDETKNLSIVILIRQVEKKSLILVISNTL